ncbi:MAG TPA: OmpA family protein [Rhizomicrobium sp.]|nr:OmpA family protein [Rhizomicrobium sp.]
MGRASASSSGPRFAALFGLCATALALSGCIGNSVFDDLNAAQPIGSPFQEALFKNYSFLAKSFGTQSAPSGQAFDADGAISLTGADNTISGLADAYALKALAVAKGDEDVLPEPAPDGDADAENVRLQLLRDLSDGREKAPEDAARAQADYDCWVMNRRVPSLAAASQACRRSVTVSLAKLEHGSNPVPAPPPTVASAQAPASVAQPVTFTVSFAERSAKLSPDQLSVVSQAIDAARQGRQSRITVVGHSDAKEASQPLSLKRADAVEKALVLQGARPEAISVSGADKDQEPHERVVVISLLP